MFRKPGTCCRHPPPNTQTPTHPFNFTNHYPNSQSANPNKHPIAIHHQNKWFNATMNTFQNAYTNLLKTRERYENLRNQKANLDEIFTAKGDLHRARNEMMYARRSLQAGR